MTKTKLPQAVITVTEVGNFLRKPPPGFSVEPLRSGYRVHSDPERSLVLIEDFDSGTGRVVFHKSLGRKVKMQNLWEYTSMRKSLVSKRIYLLASTCEDTFPEADRKGGSGVRGPGPGPGLKRFVVSIDGSNPLVRWQMEKGLDWTISSVAGESYRVEIDLTETLENWTSKNLDVVGADVQELEPVWRDASFTLKYHSDALFDFPHWFGFSKRRFNLRLT